MPIDFAYVYMLSLVGHECGEVRRLRGVVLLDAPELVEAGERGTARGAGESHGNPRERTNSQGNIIT